MSIDNQLYSLEYLRRREEWRHLYTEMARISATAFGLGSIVDVGCAGGLFVEALRTSGYEAWGLDGAPDSQALWPVAMRHYYRLGDLTHADDVELPATDFVASMEVAEHLPESCAAAYVQLLVRHQPKRVLFTAAPIGQPGVGHLNCRPFAYWVALFAARGYTLDLVGSCRFRQRLRAWINEHGSAFPKQYANNFLTFSPASAEGGAASEDACERIAILQHELEVQSAVFDYLTWRSVNVAEFRALLWRELGLPTEISEDDAWRLRTFAY